MRRRYIHYCAHAQTNVFGAGAPDEVFTVTYDSLRVAHNITTELESDTVNNDVDQRLSMRRGGVLSSKSCCLLCYSSQSLFQVTDT